MLTIQPAEQHKLNQKDRRDTLNAVIAEQVIHVLGRPAGLRKVDVRPLWENHYRVNILIGPDAASVRVANSYFLTADGDGNILESIPRITRPK